MDDLDALLADLQSTTTDPYKQYPPTDPYQQYPPIYDPSYRPHHESSGYHSDSRSSTPPPLPPPPAEHILNQVQNTQQIYEPQVIRPPLQQTTHNYYSHQSYTTTLNNNNNSTEYPHYQTSSSEFTQNFTENPRQTTETTRHYITENPCQTTETTRHYITENTRQKPMSSLTSNLSELDILLQDLNSAQFLADVDKRSSTSTSHVPNGGTRVPVTRVQGPDRTGVDALFDELDSAVATSESKHNVAGKRNSYDFPQAATQPHLTDKPVASSATQELDDIMASLSNFKMDSQIRDHPTSIAITSETSIDASYAKPNKGKGYETPSPTIAPMVPPINTQIAQEEKRQSNSPLDSMLGTLQSDLNRQGISTTTKGHCAACNQPVAGKVITAVGKVWHTEHFVCVHCKRELGTMTFYERDGQVYCENDYHALFAPRCAYCKAAIVDKCVTALGCSWHPDHFFCAHCGVPFHDDGFHEKDGQAFCKKDYFEMFAPKCGGCGYAIMDKFISALNQQWHTECFVCRECRVSFEGGSFFDHDGLPYCEMHYYEIRGSLCFSCHKPITGRCITAMGRKFHPEHFVCAFCLKQLNKGTFKEQNDKPYCHPCFVKLFG